MPNQKKFKIDMSGSTGLVTGFNKNAKQFIYYGLDTSLVDGYWNPFSNPGYQTQARTMYKIMTGSENSTLHKTCINDTVSGKFLSGSTDGHVTVWATLDTTLYTTDVTSGSPDNIIDFEVYQLNGSRKIFYSCTKSGAGYIGVTDGTTFTYDWSNGDTSTLYTGTVTGATTLSSSGCFLRYASNGYMYAFDPTFVHKIDGTTSTGGSAGTITINVFGVNQNDKIVDAADWRNMMFIATQSEATPYSYNGSVDRSTKICGIYVWNRSSVSSSTNDFIPLYGVREIKRIYVAHDGKLRMMTIGASTQFQIREYNGSSFEVIFEMDQTAAPTTLDGVTTSDYATFWLGNDFNVYAHGRPMPGNSNGVYKIGKATDPNGTVTSVGYCYFGNGVTEVPTGTDNLFLSYIRSGNAFNKTQKFLFNYSGSSPSGYTGSVLSTVVYTKRYDTPMLSNIDSVTVYMLPITSVDSGDGATAVGSIKVFLNSSTTAFKTQSVTRADARKGYIRIPVGKQYINSVQLAVDTSTTSNGTVTTTLFDMNPQYAIVDYTVTSTKR